MSSKLLEGLKAAQPWEFDEDAETAIIAGLREMRPLLQSEAPNTQSLRNPSPAVMEALAPLNMWALAVPKRLGGRGVSALGMLRISAEMAKGDPSVAWVSQIINGTTWVTTLASDAIQEELFGKCVPRICGVFNPPGIAKPVDGGYIVNGKFPYASAFRVAEWGQWGVKILHPDGREVPGNFCYIPTAQCSLENTWNVPGLQGTGSDTAVINNVFVPEHLMVHADRSYNYVAPDKKHFGAPSDYFSQIPFVHRTHNGILLGAAEALLDVVMETAKIRPMVGTNFARQMDSQVAVRDIGECAAKLMTARLLLETAARELDAAALERRAMTEQERSANKAKDAFATRIMEEAVQWMMFISGSSAFNHANPACRYWVDFNVGARHFAHLPNVGYEVYGRSLLGIEPNVMPSFMI